MSNEKKTFTNLFLVIAAVVLLGGIAWYATPTARTPAAPARVEQATPAAFATLPPSMFTGKTREAYQAAVDVPEVLREVQCYCGCKEGNGHQNNLFCFADQHAVG